MAVRKAPAKKKAKQEDPEKENSERWLLTYADMITLLMLFFIILWAMSQVDQHKFDEMTEAFQTIFQGSNLGYILQASNAKASKGSFDEGRQQRDPSKTRKEMRNALMTVLDQRMRNFIPQHQYDVTEVQDGLKITLYSDVFFAPGSAEVPREAIPLMQKVVESLMEIPNNIRIEGHTDASPVPNLTYRDNWQLSTARALSVVNIFASLGYPEDKIAAAAYGSNRLRVEGDSPENEAFNRRVEVIVLWDAGEL